MAAFFSMNPPFRMDRALGSRSEDGRGERSGAMAPQWPPTGRPAGCTARAASCSLSRAEKTRVRVPCALGTRGPDVLRGSETALRRLQQLHLQTRLFAVCPAVAPGRVEPVHRRGDKSTSARTMCCPNPRIRLRVLEPGMLPRTIDLEVQVKAHDGAS